MRELFVICTNVSWVYNEFMVIAGQTSKLPSLLVSVTFMGKPWAEAEVAADRAAIEVAANSAAIEVLFMDFLPSLLK
jgi:hypothetical protein